MSGDFGLRDRGHDKELTVGGIMDVMREVEVFQRKRFKTVVVVFYCFAFFENELVDLYI